MTNDKLHKQVVVRIEEYTTSAFDPSGESELDIDEVAADIIAMVRKSDEDQVLNKALDCVDKLTKKFGLEVDKP